MNKERAAAYLGQGVAQNQVASIMGCSPGYIAQLMKDESFQRLVQKHQLSLNGTPEAEEQSIQAKYVGLEHQIIKSIGDQLQGAELRDLTRTLEVVANRQEKVAQRKMPSQIGGGNSVNVGVTVQLTLPQHAIPVQPVIELNGKSEVVAINAKPMAPMSSVGVERLFKEKQKMLKADAILKEIPDHA